MDCIEQSLSLKSVNLKECICISLLCLKVVYRNWHTFSRHKMASLHKNDKTEICLRSIFIINDNVAVLHVLYCRDSEHASICGGVTANRKVSFAQEGHPCS